MSKHLCPSVVCSLVILTGCTTVVETPRKPDLSPTIKVEDKSAETVSEPSIPEDLLYTLLSAEIAGQKGAYDVALDSYLAAANLSRSPKVAERATQIALFNKDQKKALEAASIWLQSNPKSVMAARITVMLNVKLKDYDEAIRQLESLRSLDEKEFGKTILEIAKHLEKKGNKNVAQEFIGRLQDTFPGHADIHYASALLAMKYNDLERANSEVTRALDLRPNWNQAGILRARIISRQGDSKSAVLLLKKMVEGQPDNDKLRMIFARFLINLEDYRLAEVQLNEIVSTNPEQYDAVYSLALVNLQNSQVKEAKELLEKLVDVPRWQEQAFFHLGRIEAKDKHNDRAIAWFEKIVHGPLMLDAQINIVSILAAGNKPDHAIEKLKILQGRYPSQAHRFYIMEAELLNRQKDYEGAFEVLSHALKSAPDQPELLYTRALVAENLGRLDVLEQDLVRVLKSNPDDPNALNALGYTLADRTDRYAEAKTYLERAIMLQPNDPVIMDSYGWLQYRLGNLGQALDYLQRAYKLNQDPEISSHLGEVLWVLGKRNEAKTIWKSGLDKHPDNKHLLMMKQHFPAAFDE